MTNIKRPHVLFASSELAPFAKSGGLGDVIGSLPKALNDIGIKCSTIIPFYKSIPNKLRVKATKIREVEVILNLKKYYCGLMHMEYEGMDMYFVDNEFFFYRDQLYGYGDEAERYLFFSQAVAACITYMPDIDVLHCHDWQTGIIPMLINMHYKHLPKYSNLKTVFTIHNLKFQGRFGPKVCGEFLGFDDRDELFSQVEYYGDMNIMKAAIKYCDALTTVSPTYAKEICTPRYGEGLDGLIKEHEYKLKGIINGIDTVSFDPVNDERIYSKYSNFAGKYHNKTAFQREFALKEDKDIFLIGIVSRLDTQKGLDLLSSVAEDMLKLPIQFALLGTGDGGYEDYFRQLENNNREQVRSFIMFDVALAQKIYAACDLFLMPSAFEPCGLSQLISMRYGALPLVRETGGLKDTVKPHNIAKGNGTGFTFTNYNPNDLISVIRWANELYNEHRDVWGNMVDEAMAEDWSWQIPALEYIELYNELLR